MSIYTYPTRLGFFSVDHWIVVVYYCCRTAYSSPKLCSCQTVRIENFSSSGCSSQPGQFELNRSPSLSVNFDTIQQNPLKILGLHQVYNWLQKFFSGMISYIKRCWSHLCLFAFVIVSIPLVYANDWALLLIQLVDVEDNQVVQPKRRSLHRQQFLLSRRKILTDIGHVVFAIFFSGQPNVVAPPLTANFLPNRLKWTSG